MGMCEIACIHLGLACTNCSLSQHCSPTLSKADDGIRNFWRSQHLNCDFHEGCFTVTFMKVTSRKQISSHSGAEPQSVCTHFATCLLPSHTKQPSVCRRRPVRGAPGRQCGEVGGGAPAGAAAHQVVLGVQLRVCTVPCTPPIRIPCSAHPHPLFCCRLQSACIA